MRTKRALVGVFAGLVSIGLILSGCAAGGGTADPSTSGKATLDPAGDTNAQPASAVAQGGTLRVPLQSFPPNWNYSFIDGTLADTDLVMQTMVQKPFVIGLDGAPTLNTDLLVSAEPTSTTPLVIEYKINPAATWSDGTPITWADFEATFRALNGTDPAYTIADSTGYNSMASVTQGATVKDAIVTYATPFADWKSMFAPFYPASQIGTPAGFNTAYADAIPVTAGPFKLEELNTSARTISVVPDPTWWGDPPKLDRIIFIALDSSADVDAYLNKEIDLVAAGTTERYGRVSGAPDTALRAAPSASYTHVDFSSSGIFADKQLRLAVQKAVDRASLSAVIVGDLPYDIPLLNNHIYLGTDATYQDNAGDVGSFDPAAAKAILEAAGWTGDGAVRTKDGKNLTFAITIPAGAVSSSQMAQVIQSQLAAVGMQMTINEVASDAFFSDNITPGAYDMTIFLWGGTGYPAAGASIYRSGAEGQNYGRISSPALDTMLTEVVTDSDPVSAAALWNEIDTAIWAEGHSMPIIQSPRIIAINPTIANYGARPGAADVDWKIVGFMS